MKTGEFPQDFCVAPWKVSHLSPQGDVFTCYEGSEILGNIHETSLLDIWQGERFVTLRRKMLAGEALPQCSRCRVKESVAAGQSLKTVINSTVGIETVKAVFREKELHPALNPRVLDLAFSNTCNLKCRMCSSYYSAFWREDEKAVHGQARAPAASLSRQQFEKNILPLLGPEVRKIILAGGEPLIGSFNKDVLRFLLTAGLQSVMLEYSSNGTVIEDELLELWRRFPNVKVNLSVDASRERLEYLRKGASWEGLLATIERIRKECAHVRLSCYSTLSVFNIISYPGLVRELLESRIFSLDELSLNFLASPAHYSACILPASVKMEIKKSYHELITGYLLPRFDFLECRRLILQLKMLLNYMVAEDRSELLGEFFDSCARLDKVRGESLLEVFPELKPVIRSFP